MVGQAFQPVILFSETCRKKKITGWKPVPRKKAGPKPSLYRTKTLPSIMIEMASWHRLPACVEGPGLRAAPPRDLPCS